MYAIRSYYGYDCRCETEPVLVELPEPDETSDAQGTGKNGLKPGYGRWNVILARNLDRFGTSEVGFLVAIGGTLILINRLRCRLLLQEGMTDFSGDNAYLSNHIIR